MSHAPLESAPVFDPPKPSIRTEWRTMLVLALWFVAAAIAVGAHRDIPVIDDWTYAWSVERLLDDGQIEVLDWSAVYPLGHSLWGAAWSLVLGFSFVTLRLSTMTLALLATCALYLILRELEASRRVALLGALTVAANPVFLLLSSSFMTDVPFVACTLMSLLCYIRAMRRGHTRLLWWGGAWACLAFLDRQIGGLTPLAALPMLVRRGEGETKRSTVLLALAVTWAVMLASSVAMLSLVRPTGEMIKLVDRLQFLFLVSLRSYVNYNLYVLSSMAFYALPALLAMAAIRRAWRAPALVGVVLAVGALMMASMGEIPVPLRPGSTWTLAEVGGSRGLINGVFAVSKATTLEIILRGTGLLAFALALLSLRWKRSSDEPAARSDWTNAPLRGRLLEAVRTLPITTRTPLVVYLAAYLVVANVLWMYNDRYLIVLLPVIVALALGGSHRGVEKPHLAWVALAIFAAVAVVGTRDALRFNQGVRDSWQALVDSGVRPSDIDAGYAWTGWYLYAHPENLSKGVTVRDVPWITSKRRPTYILAKSPITGYDIVREVDWSDDAPWPGPDRLLILKRQAAPQ